MRRINAISFAAIAFCLIILVIGIYFDILGIVWSNAVSDVDEPLHGAAAMGVIFMPIGLGLTLFSIFMILLILRSNKRTATWDTPISYLTIVIGLIILSIFYSLLFNAMIYRNSEPERFINFIRSLICFVTGILIIFIILLGISVKAKNNKLNINDQTSAIIQELFEPYRMTCWVISLSYLVIILINAISFENYLERRVYSHLQLIFITSSIIYIISMWLVDAFWKLNVNPNLNRRYVTAKKKRLLAVVVIINLLLASGGIYIWNSGRGKYITEDTTWTKDNSPYLFDEDIYVMEGATLTIEPGVVIKFKDFGGLIIKGTLKAKGTQDNPIIFSTHADTPLEHYFKWDGIKIMNSRGNVIEHASVKYSEYGIQIINSSASLSNVEISNIFKSGIVVKDSSSSEISNCSLTKIKETGISIESGSQAIISHNIIKDFVEDGIAHTGIYIGTDKIVKILYNDLSNTGSTEISCYSNSTIISYNNIRKNKWGNTLRYSGDDLILNAENNYWGVMTYDDINSTINGNVDFEPWLNEPI